jgi:heme A synthase
MPRRVHFCGGRLNKTVKLITAITGLLVAIGTLIGAITVTLGKENKDGGSYSYTTIILDSPEKYEEFLMNHPAG